ncbi:MAG: hypothetical protein IPJ85_17520 [Flavobacteriales bacterium]|nr:hypothetical protein [Flavobacteriales bacterium]
MMRAILFTAAISAAGMCLGQDQSYADCLLKTSSRWGAPCEHCQSYVDGFKRDFSGTFQVEFKNACREVIEVKVAMQEKNGTWRAFPVRALGPDERIEAFACEGSGKYLYWVRRANDTEITLPTDREIILAYTTR